jgi:hypothetical protein
MARISGVEAHLGRISRLTSKQTQKAILAGLFVGGNLVQTEAQLSITRGSVSGANHVPSAPGEPPNNNWGGLAKGIITYKTGPLTVDVASTAEYALAMEYGMPDGRKPTERPYMRPAAKKMKPEVVATIKDIINKVMARKGV